MAKIGLDNLLYATIESESEGKVIYNAPANFGAAIDCSVSIETESAELYADNSLCESDYGFKNGTVKLGIAEGSDELFAEILGHEIGEDGEMVRNANDSAPYCALGRILEKLVNGKRVYKVEFLNKIKFKEPSQEEKTRGESLEFGTYSVEGTIAKLANGDWSKTKSFATKAEAKEYLTGLFTQA